MSSARGIEPLSEFEHIPDPDWKGAFRPSLTHWNRGREPKLLSLVQVAEQLDSFWGTDKLTLYEEYHGDQPCCLFIDYDRQLPIGGSLEESFRDLLDTVITPINTSLGSVSDSLLNLSPTQVAISHDCRNVQREVSFSATGTIWIHLHFC